MSKNGNILPNKKNIKKYTTYCKNKKKISKEHRYKIYVSISRGKKKRMCVPLNLLRGETAENLIQKFGLDETIPVNLDKLLNAYGIIVYPTDFSELSTGFPEIANEINKRGQILGAVATQEDELRILYRNTDSRHRQKFTIAHELAHCCLDTDLLLENGHIEYRKDISAPSNDIKEINANAFAGELLIPKTVLDKIYSKVETPNIDALSDVFDVSKNVMRERLKKLGLPFSESVDFRTYFNYGYLLTQNG